MLDFSQVARFAARLSTPPPEEEWQDEWKGKLAAEMRALAPSRTGALRASIHTTKEGVEVGVDYGAFVEYGTSDTAPQPFAGPSVNRLIRPATKDAGDRIIRQLT